MISPITVELTPVKVDTIVAVDVCSFREVSLTQALSSN